MMANDLLRLTKKVETVQQERKILQQQLSTMQDQTSLITDLPTQYRLPHDESVGLCTLNKFLEEWLCSQKEVKELWTKLGT